MVRIKTPGERIALIKQKIRSSPIVWGLKEAVFLDQIRRKRQGKRRKKVEL